MNWSGTVTGECQRWQAADGTVDDLDDGSNGLRCVDYSLLEARRFGQGVRFQFEFSDAVDFKVLQLGRTLQRRFGYFHASESTDEDHFDVVGETRRQFAVRLANHQHFLVAIMFECPLDH